LGAVGKSHSWSVHAVAASCCPQEKCAFGS
jgi:hypothetical protein